MAWRPASVLPASLAVALWWAPLPGIAAVYFAVRAEHARHLQQAGDAERLTRWAWAALAASVAFGFAEIALFGTVEVAAWVLRTVRGTP